MVGVKPQTGAGWNPTEPALTVTNRGCWSWAWSDSPLGRTGERSVNEFQSFTADTLYELLTPYDAEYPAYTVALTSEYAAGTRVAECWLFNVNGGLHPGYTISPVPIEIEQVKRRIGRVVVEEVVVTVFRWDATG